MSSPAWVAAGWPLWAASVALIVAAIGMPPHWPRVRLETPALVLLAFVGLWAYGSGWRFGRALAPSPMAALAGVASMALLWSLTLGEEARRLRRSAALLLGALLILYRLMPIGLAPALQPRGALFDLAVASLSAGAGALALVILAWCVPGLTVRTAITATLLGWALWFQVLGLVAQAVGAQWAWGAYWSWDPLEAWRMAATLVSAIAAVGVERLGWRGRAAAVAAALAAVTALWALIGAAPLIRWLGLGSMYLVG